MTRRRHASAATAHERITSMMTPRPSRIRTAILTLALALGVTCAGASTASANFGITSFEAAATNEVGGPFTQAGGHPYELTTSFSLNTTIDGTGPFKILVPDQNVKDVEVALPPGLIGNAQALPECAYSEFTAGICPPSTQVGTVTVDIDGLPAVSGVYNMVPRPGEPAEFATYAAFQIVIDFKVRTGTDYGITAPLENLSTANGVTGSSLTIWGSLRIRATTTSGARCLTN